MSWVGAIRDFFRELKDSTDALGIGVSDRPLLVYSEDAFTWNQLQGYVEAVAGEHQIPVVYVTSDPDDPLFERHPENMRVFYVDRLVRHFLPRVDSPVFLTTMPDLGQLHVDRPGADVHCLYTFHSLNSIHEVYRRGAFDYYNAFFCTGPHHKKELDTHFSHYGLPRPLLYEVGYYKLDRVHQAYQWHIDAFPDDKTVLVAPSWGPGNLLEAHGVEVVERALSMGVRVVVRPHPCFFQPIYPKGAEVVAEIAERFEDHERFTLERTIVSESSFYEADLMVCDFSGAAFEYALGTARPVLFVDVARKTRNPDWGELGLPTFEDTMRSEVGRVISPDEVGGIDGHINAMLGDGGWGERLEALRSTAVYNFGRSAEVGAEIIRELIEARQG